MTKKIERKTIIITRIHEYISGTLVTGIENGPNWTRGTTEYNKDHPDSPSVMALDPSGLTNWINLN